MNDVTFAHNDLEIFTSTEALPLCCPHSQLFGASRSHWQDVLCDDLVRTPSSTTSTSTSAAAAVAVAHWPVGWAGRCVSYQVAMSQLALQWRGQSGQSPAGPEFQAEKNFKNQFFSYSENWDICTWVKLSTDVQIWGCELRKKCVWRPGSARTR